MCLFGAVLAAQFVVFEVVLLSVTVVALWYLLVCCFICHNCGISSGTCSNMELIVIVAFLVAVVTSGVIVVFVVVLWLL